MIQTDHRHITEQRGRGRWRRRTRAGALLLTVAAMLTGMLVNASPASADVALDQVLCRNGARGAPSLSESSVPWGTTVTVTWHTTLPAACSNGGVNPRFFIRALGLDPETESSNGVGPNGSMTFDAALSTAVSLDISAGETRTLGGARLTVDPLLSTPLDPGKTVGVSDNSLASRRKFVQAVQSPDTTVWVGGNVELNLSGLNEILVAPGVQIMGDRSLNPRGPRLFTYTFPNRLFYIGTTDGPSDNVRVTGIRFDGHEPSEPCLSAGGPDSIAITVSRSQHLEIDHNEFYGWRGAGVDVHDPRAPGVAVGRINRDNAETVWVHDNSMHDNQHPTACVPVPLPGSKDHGAGYGISVNEGAYALIERNVFDRNRHAIAGHGAPGDGYIARNNLFLHPGVDSVKAGITTYNHQIDMHGLKTCGNGEHFNCGPAGEYMEVAYNTVVFDDSDAIQLRGTPTSADGMSVHHNVFAQDRGHALTQTENGLVDNGGNVFGQDGPLGDKFSKGAGNPGGGVCDFDRDGVQDAFRTTGVTWWYYSSVLGRWVWLRQSPLSANGKLGDINGDGRCDVPTGAGTFFTPSGADFDVTLPANQTGEIGQPADLQLVQVGPGRLAWRAFGLPPGLSIDSGTGRIQGTPSQRGSYAVRFRARDAKDATVEGYFQWTIDPTNTPVPIRVPFVVGKSFSEASGVLRSAGLGTPTQHEVVDGSCAKDVGTVIGQTPSAGTVEPPGFVVHLEVEAWPKPPKKCN